MQNYHRCLYKKEQIDETMVCTLIFGYEPIVFVECSPHQNKTKKLLHFLWYDTENEKIGRGTQTARWSHKRPNKIKWGGIHTQTAKYVGFEFFIAVVMKSIIIWDMTPCTLLSVNRCFGGTYRLHLQNRINKFSKKTASRWCLAFFCWTYFFDPEDGGDMFLRNVRWNSMDYTASYTRRWYSS
jgi:hypothetical protein